jgi:Calcineurin-like phosphoesterase
VKRGLSFPFIALFLMLIFAASSATAQQWKFGVMSDTQWIGTDDGRNPGSTSVDIIKALNKQFADHHVKFVVQVGDLVDQTGSTTTSVANSEDVRAAFAQELFNAGIGFFPLPGNHDSQPLAGIEFRRIYPQTLDGKMNVTPANVFTVPNPDAAGQPFPTVAGRAFVDGRNFSTPGIVFDPNTQTNADWTGVSYSFTYRNASFVLLDQFSPLNTTTNYNPYPKAIDLQQPWINSVLGGMAPGTHAFVFGHKGLVTENHVDTLFGSDPSQDPSGQDAFITALYKAGVRYYIQGHDHMHDRSLVSVTTGTPTDGKSAKIQNILCASDSSKFYTPGMPSNDEKYDVPAFGHPRQAQLAQELHTVGFYIFTVDGPRVTVDFYSAPLSNVAPAGCSGANCEWLIPTTPQLNFSKTETFGYSLNGKEFQVCQAGQASCNSSYTQVADSYHGTTARILSGTNGSKAVDFDNRSFIKTVDTGWSDRDFDGRDDHDRWQNDDRRLRDDNDDLQSEILTLWGMADLGTDQTDTYTLALNNNSCKSHFGRGDSRLALVTRNSYGDWVNAVDLNKGSFSKRYVAGPWKPGYDLGTYGYDSKTNTAWAVINYNGDFAVSQQGR